MQMEDPAAKADYAKGNNCQKHSAYLVAIGDHLKTPKMDYSKA